MVLIIHFQFYLKEWPHVVWYNNHLPVISSQQIMVHECDWGVNSVTGCSISICHHNVMNHLFIRKSAWNDYLFVAFISIADSAKSNPGSHGLRGFDCVFFWTARNVYQQYHHYFDLFMLTSDFIFTFVFSMIKVEQVLSLLSNPDNPIHFHIFFTHINKICWRACRPIRRYAGGRGV